MQIEFWKMSGAGNDFVLIEDRNYCTDILCSMAKKLCRRRLSIGADGLLAVCRLENGNIRMRYFNPDGTEAFCGNGSRCSLWWAYRRGLCGIKTNLEALPGILAADIYNKDGNPNAGAVRMAMPDVRPAQIIDLAFTDGRKVKAISLDTGVPHCVIVLEQSELPIFDVEKEGRAIRYNNIFQKGTNVDFVATGQDGTVNVRTYERGVEAETLACGTGITASAIAAGISCHIKSPVSLKSRSGEPFIIWHKLSNDNSASEIFMQGPAEIVFNGVIDC